MEQAAAIGAGYLAFTSSLGIPASITVSAFAFWLPHALRGFFIDKNGRDLFSWVWEDKLKRMARTRALVTYNFGAAGKALLSTPVIMLAIGASFVATIALIQGFTTPYTVISFAALTSFHIVTIRWGKLEAFFKTYPTRHRLVFAIIGICIFVCGISALSRALPRKIPIIDSKPPASKVEPVDNEGMARKKVVGFFNEMADELAR